eukprot:m.77237 g.77237  ORF g.77237 m.77237 type:complete len:548 (-) comp12611_c0_seq1:71-1714(-)
MHVVFVSCIILQALGDGDSRPPHIVHVLADDFGWADVGYHRTEEKGDVMTPTLDSLKASGIELDRFYVHKICSPTRSAIQSGRAPVHVNVQNVLPEVSNPKDAVGGYQGIPTNMTGLAAVLKKGQYPYKTHIVGKWDVGMATEEHHPRARGYDSWIGYWHHSNDYWEHTVDTCGTKSMYDLWEYNETYDGPALRFQNGKLCSQKNQNPENQTCVFEESVFTNEVLRIINGHDESKPLFLFYSMHLTHMPLQVPTAYEQKFGFINNSYRRLNHAMGNYLDEAVLNVTTALKQGNLWNTTLFVFHSDNGGEILGAGVCGGNNWPLTGGKFTNFEGGIRVNAFVAGGAVPLARRGTLEDSYITGWDWYSTYAHLAGVSPVDTEALRVGLPPIDSIDMWPLLSGSNSTPPRHEIVIGDTSAINANGDGNALVGGLIQGDYKLLVGSKDELQFIEMYVQTGPSWPNDTSHLVPEAHPKLCGRSPNNGCLFNIKEDPTERNNLANTQQAIFKSMLARIEELQQRVYSPKRGSKNPQACKVASAQHDYWGPFLP